MFLLLFLLDSVSGCVRGKLQSESTVQGALQSVSGAKHVRKHAGRTTISCWGYKRAWTSDC